MVVVFLGLCHYTVLTAPIYRRLNMTNWNHKEIISLLESDNDLYMTLDTALNGNRIKVINLYESMDNVMYIPGSCMWTAGGGYFYKFSSAAERHQILEPLIGPLPLDGSKVYKLSREDKDGILLAIKMVNL